MENYLYLMDCDNSENKENQENLDGLSPESIADASFNLCPSGVELKQLIQTPFLCETCGYKTVRKDCFKEHLIKTHIEVNCYSCKYCDFETNNKKTLTDHAQVHLIEKPFVCKICNSSFTSKPSLQSHARTHIGGKPFACHICYHYRTSTNTALQRHLKVNHAEPYGCGICDSSFADKVLLKDHLWKIHCIKS